MEPNSVLHFYIGSKIKIEKSNYYLVHELSIHNKDEVVLTAHVLWILETRGRGVEFKLILRPLSSMTEKEAEDFGMMYEQGKYHSEVLEFDSRIGASTSFIGADSAAERITRLLKAGFDLFNLIPTNQAIDSTKL